MQGKEQPIETVEKLEITLQDITELMRPLKEFHAIFSPLFARREQREWAEIYLLGLLSPEMDRKSIEPMVLNLKGADGNAVRAVQQFIGEGGWTDDPIRKRHWQEVERTLGEEDGVIPLDGSDFPKQGKESAGVKRQYCGQLGKRANCQAGVFAGYVSSKGYTLLDSRLYMPEEWFNKEYADRRKKCRIPKEIRFQTKNELAWEMLEAIDREGTLRFRWVVCDEAFGCDTWLLDQIAGLKRWYFAEVPRNTQVWTHRPKMAVPLWSGRGRKPKRPTLLDGQPLPHAVHDIADFLPVERWSRHTIKEGSKGPIVADFAALRVIGVRAGLPGPEVWLVLRRNIDTGEVKFYLSNAPAEMELTTLVRMSGMRWPIDICFEDGKQLLGMGDYEVRSWIGWYHHMTLCMLAHYFLVRLQQQFKKNSPPDFAPGIAIVDGRPTQTKSGLPYGCRCAGLSYHP
jgi:SRSO17 transposase